MNWSNKKVLVTGGGGFIGSHLAERLVREGATTRAMVSYNALGRRGWLDRSELVGEMEVFSGDIRDRDSVLAAMRDVDVVFHLAALIAIPYSYQAPGSYVDTNVNGTLNVLQAARQLGTERIVHTSTSEVYGSAQFVPITEEHPLVGQSPYSASKIGADKMAESFYLSFDVPVATVRPFNTFGPRQSARAVIPTIITQCLAGRDIALGSLTPTRDFNFVENTVDGFLAAASSPGSIGRTVNLGSGREISVSDLAKTILEIVGGGNRLVEDEQRKRPEKSEVDRLLAANELAAELLDWRPRVTLEQGLERTVDWFRDNLTAYRPDEYTV